MARYSTRSILLLTLIASAAGVRQGPFSNSCAFLPMKNIIRPSTPYTRMSKETLLPLQQEQPQEKARPRLQSTRPYDASIEQPQQQNQQEEEQGSVDELSENIKSSIAKAEKKKRILQSTEATFDLKTALFCAGLAFDAYSEPSNSSRWEKGSKGLNVAFQSASYTRSLYKGLLRVTTKNCTDLPDQEGAAEGVLSGSGVDPYVLVAVAEGTMEEDLQSMEEEFSLGVPGLRGSAHVGRSTTVWSNVDERQANAKLARRAKQQKKKKDGEDEEEKTTTATKEDVGGGYYIPSSWGKGGQAIWKDERPFYLYVSEPKTARLVFTVLDEDVLAEDQVIGSAWRKLSAFFPLAAMSDPIDAMKKLLLHKSKEKGVDKLEKGALARGLVQSWEGTLKLKSKPRKKDKKGQVAMGVAAGAMLAGPAGAAVGGFLGNLYESSVRGTLGVELQYLPLPNVEAVRERYEVKGGLPGVYWGKMYERYLERNHLEDVAAKDLEFCVFVTHDETGCSCALYRSLEKKLVAVTFRGTCAPIDLLTDASIVQTPWVEGVEVKNNEDVQTIPMVHVGFRKSLQSISRRLKELVLGAIPPGEDLSDYDLFITGHSLGGALATLFATDVAEFGVDAGRGLPQLDPSEPWWEGLVSTLRGTSKVPKNAGRPPPRPKSVRLYSFGSPRVGNSVFISKFDSLLQKGNLDEGYRVVNNADIVARLPRSVNALVFGSIGYDHCGATALVSLPSGKKATSETASSESSGSSLKPMLWVEGESSDDECPVRDGTPLTSPLADGMLLGDLFTGVKNISMSSVDAMIEPMTGEKSEKVAGPSWTDLAGKMAESVSGRLQTMSASDLTSIFGVKKQYAEREAKIIASVMSGEAIGHHMEDAYYGALGRAAGFLARVGEDLVEVDDADEWENEREAALESEETIRS